LSVIKKLFGLRVSEAHEIEGLDKAEHKDMSYRYHHDPIIKCGES
jgi:ammonia channel protein AmtB